MFRWREEDGNVAPPGRQGRAGPEDNEGDGKDGKQHSELIFGGKSGIGGCVNFFVSCVNFLEKQSEMLYNFK